MRGDTILLAVSSGLDIVEKEIGGIALGHNRRVAALCHSIGRALGMDADELITLSACALFHDSALTEWLATGGERIAHCTMGQNNIDTLPLPKSATDIVLYHHERADGSGLFGVRDIPISAEIICFADSYDHRRPLDGFSPYICDAFDEQAVDSDSALPEWYLPASEAMKFGGIIAKIIDYKSKFTRRHTLGIAEKSEYMARFYNYGEEETAKLYLAACLHDLGKLATPTEVLEKPGKLSDHEFKIIKDHVSYTYDLLGGVDSDIRQWASAHHEKLDGTGYPFGHDENSLDFNSRLMACIDIYQAVSEERPYHPARSHEETMAIMHKMADNGVIDTRIVKDLESAFA